MTSTKAIKKRLGRALLGGVALLGAGAAQAQVAGALPYREDPGAALTRHLKSLSDDPRSLYALMGAAQAALQLGDPQAAVTFFARAEEIAPRDGRIKAGMGAAFVQMEQAQSAFKFFSDASSLGVAEAEFAGDRGLAYDLVGNNRQAQRDYRIALRHKKDPEIERRLALSLAISGDKAGAIQAIGDQLVQQDRAAWRTRAFILALTGDAAGATKAVEAVMPGQAGAMQPFLARLASLDAQSRAMAVHFGHFPGDGRPVQMAQATPFVGPPLAIQPGRPDAGQTALGTRPSRIDQAGTAPRRRPDIVSSGASSPPAQVSAPPAAVSTTRRTEARAPEARPVQQARTAATTPSAPATPTPTPTPTPAPEPAPTPTPVRNDGVPAIANPPAATSSPLPGITPAASATAASLLPREAPAVPTYTPPTLEPFGPPAFDASATAAPAASVPVPVPSSTGAGTPAAGIQTVALPGSLTATTAPPPAPEATLQGAASQASVQSTPAPEAPTAPMTRKPLAFAEVVEAVRALPDTARAPARVEEAAAVPARQAARSPAPKPAAETAEKKPDAAAGPARHWVQIASAPDTLVSSEYRRLKRKHATLLGDKDGYRTQMGKSNRVLVGPFASAGEARDFVGQLKKNSLTAVAWTSGDGQEIEKLPAK